MIKIMKAVVSLIGKILKMKITFLLTTAGVTNQPYSEH